MAPWKRPFRNLRRQFRISPRIPGETPSKAGRLWKDLTADGAVGAILASSPAWHTSSPDDSGRYGDCGCSGWGAVAIGVFLYGSAWAMPFLGLAMGIHAWIAVSYKIMEGIRGTGREGGGPWTDPIDAGRSVPDTAVGRRGLSISPSTLTLPYYRVEEGDALLMHRMGPPTTPLPRGTLVRFNAAIYGNTTLWARQETLGQIVGLPGETVFLRGDAFVVAGQVLPPERFPIPVWLQGLQATIPVPEKEYFISAGYNVRGHGGVVDGEVIREMTVVSGSDVKAAAFMRWWPLARRGFIEVGLNGSILTTGVWRRPTRRAAGSRRSPSGMPSTFSGRPPATGSAATMSWPCGTTRRVLEQNNTVFEGWAGQVLMLIELGRVPRGGSVGGQGPGVFPEHPELLALKAIACMRDAQVWKGGRLLGQRHRPRTT